MSTHGQIKILFVGVSPDEMTRLDLQKEAEMIQRRLSTTAFGDRFELVQRWMSAVGDLPGLLQQYRPQLVHVSGHGAQDGRLYFRARDGSPQLANAQAVAELFDVLGGVRCVVLNACYSSEQARQIADHVEAVVGMSAAVRDEDAIAFAAGFYEALGHGQNVQTAVELGRLQIHLSESLGEDVCVLHVREGVDASRLSLHEPDVGAAVDADWLAAVRRGLVGTLAPPRLSGLGSAELRAGVTIDELFVGPLLERSGEGLHPALERLPHFGDEQRRGLLLRFEDFERAWFGAVEDGGPLRVVVRGGAGSGKSMICRYLATRAAKGSGPLPLVVRARDWAQGARRGLLEHIALRATSILNVEITAGQLQDLCSAGAAHLFVDGFDELPLAEREGLRDHLHGFGVAFPKVPVIVTSRPAHSLASKLGLDAFVELQLTPFTDEQLHEFAQRWGERLVGSSDESLWRAFEAEPYAMHLARVPLFAALLAFIHARNGQLPPRRARLYERCIDAILVNWAELHGRQLPEPSGDHLRPMLEKLALAIQSGRNDQVLALFGFYEVSLTDEVLDRRLLDELSRSRPELDEGERLALRRSWRRWLVDDSGLLYESEPNQYEFTHLTMVEYLAARAAQRGHGVEELAPLVEFVRARYEYPTWRNTLLFLLDDRRESELANAVFEALLNEEHHEDTLSFLLMILCEGHSVFEELCVRLLEACIDSDAARHVLVSRYLDDVLADEVHGELLRRWLAERLAKERGARLAALLMCVPEAFPVEVHLEGRSIDSLEPLALLDSETAGLFTRGQLYRGLALVPNRFRLCWAFNLPWREVFARARHGLESRREPWPLRWIPTLLSRSTWLSELAVDDAPTSQWSIEGLRYWAPARLAFSCRCDSPRQGLDAMGVERATVEGRAFNVLVGHDYLRSLRALGPDACPARIAAAIIDDLPPESFSSSDIEGLRHSLERLPTKGLERVIVAEGEGKLAPGPEFPEGFPSDWLVGTSRALAVIGQVHTASLGADPTLANELAIERLLHLALLWDLDARLGGLSLRWWPKATVEEQALYLSLALVQFQTTWTWPRHPCWGELISSQPSDDGVVEYLWHLCRHVAGIGQPDELSLAYAALDRDVNPELAACLRRYRVDKSAAHSG